MAYNNNRTFTLDHTKIPNTDQTNFPVYFTTKCDTLNGAIDNVQTNITVTVGQQIRDGDYILIGSERILITAGGGTVNLTGTRAQLGTVGAAHSNGAVVTNCFLCSTANGGDVLNASGFDIIFATDALGTTPLAYERVTWDAANGMTEAHVLFPTAGHAVDSVIYVLWGNAAIVTDQSNPTAVWASYKCVNHMPDGTTLSVADSTGNNVPVNTAVTASAAGKIDGAGSFNGTTAFINNTNAVSNFTGSVTMEAWVNPSSTATAVIMSNETANDGYQMYVAVGGFMAIYCLFSNYISGGTFSTAASANVLPTGVLSHVVAVNDAGTMHLYVNGVLQPLQLPSGAGAIGASTNPFLVGKQVGGFFFGGVIDETRLSASARSADWIAAEFNNQSSPNTFYSLGAPISPSSAGRVTQAIVEIMILQNPNARVTQAVVEIMVLPYTPPPPIPGQGIAIVGGGPASIRERSKGGCNPKITHYDYCLEAEGMMLRKITFPPSCSIPKEYCNLLPWDDTYGATPEQSFPFLKQAGIVTPTTASGDNVVVSFRVTPGYDGLLSGFYFQYSGAGFSQGSGDIIWRIKINQRYVKDLSNVAFLLGDPVNPIPMTQGQIITPGQTIQAVVNIPNLSGMIQIGNSTVYAGLLGFFWPR